MTSSTPSIPVPPRPALPPGQRDRSDRGPLLERRGGWNGDSVLRVLAYGGALTVLFMVGALLSVLIYAAAPSIKTFGVKFLVSSQWRPNELEVIKKDAGGKVVRDEDGEPVTVTLPAQFGALPVIYGTAVTSALALLFAVPLSIGAALFLVRIASRRLVVPVSFLIEFLAAIPSIAYGIWGLMVMVPFVQRYVEPPLNAAFARVPGLRWLHANAVTGRDVFSGSLILAIMVLPIVTAVSRDVLRAVPRSQIEGTSALGATWWQSCWEMLRYSRSGLFGAVMLGLARAAGETMAVTMVIGNLAQISGSPFQPAQTMSSLLANEFSEASTDLHRSALLQVALILFVMSLTFNLVARRLVVGTNRHAAVA